jgi:hypothetical protein
MNTRPVPVRLEPLRRKGLGTADGLDGHVWYFLSKNGDRDKREKIEKYWSTCPSSPSRPSNPSIHAAFQRTGTGRTGRVTGIAGGFALFSAPQLYTPVMSYTP